MRLIPERDPLPRHLAFLYLALGAVGVLLLHLAGPWLERAAFCPLRRTVGLPCPTCGGTHAALALARLDVSRAFAENPLVVTAALALAGWIAWAVATTLVPGWRRSVVLARGERAALRVAVVALILGTWVYEIARLG
jgi:hypothetical protein